MNDLSSSLILLLVALVLLYLAVTDKLGRVLDAWTVIKTGSVNPASTTGAPLGPVSSATSGGANSSSVPTSFHIPSLPKLGYTDSVGI